MNIENLPDRALSIRQPWVWAILNAGKRIENRPRRFHYRGPICLHASLWTPRTSTEASRLRRDVFCVLDQTYAGENLFHKRLDFPAWSNGGFVLGGIVGTAEIVDCVEQSDSPWFFGPYGLVLENVTPLPFISVKGALGLFRWKDRLANEGER